MIHKIQTKDHTYVYLNGELLLKTYKPSTGLRGTVVFGDQFGPIVYNGQRPLDKKEL